MLAKVYNLAHAPDQLVLNQSELALVKADPKVYLVVRRWKEWHPHLHDEIENIELLKEDGTVHFLYNLFRDPDWEHVWCIPNGSGNFKVEFEEDAS